MELTEAWHLLMAHVLASEWFWHPGSEADEIENATPQTSYLPCAKSYWDFGSDSALYPVLREGKERVGGGLGFLQAPPLTSKAIQMRGSTQARSQALYKMIS